MPIFLLKILIWFLISFNGTWVNGNLVGVKNRVMLRNHDEIQLFKRTSYPENDLRQKCKTQRVINHKTTI